MIQIDDYDLPIQVAEKIITGTKELSLTPVMQAVRKAFTGIDEGEKSTTDMFTLEEIEEIASYLQVYVYNHRNGD